MRQRQRATVQRHRQLSLQPASLHSGREQRSRQSSTGSCQTQKMTHTQPASQRSGIEGLSHSQSLCRLPCRRSNQPCRQSRTPGIQLVTTGDQQPQPCQLATQRTAEALNRTCAHAHMPGWWPQQGLSSSAGLLQTRVSLRTGHEHAHAAGGSAVPASAARPTPASQQARTNLPKPGDQESGPERLRHQELAPHSRSAPVPATGMPAQCWPAVHAVPSSRAKTPVTCRC